ncbi:unnamed protein product [Cladocopium goreaui]|uniref:Uncharacterized protein n=1 Tax=Cladocopium goreaui TaxID=2562237 RepID=A0A9P1GB65_9DINO|nr:unnamed protein product [Cladocopium goreaui]
MVDCSCQTLLIAVSGVPDVTTVHVLPEWVDTWDGCKALEDELQVLIVFERLRGQSAFSHGHLAGLPYKQMNSEGQEFEKYQPVIVKKISPGGTRVQVTWCFDGLLKDEDSSKLQAAVRVSIMGTQQSRAKAVLRILMSADQGAQGLLASQLEALEKAGDVFGCDGGPGSYGLQKFDMMVDTPHVRKFMRFLGACFFFLIDLDNILHTLVFYWEWCFVPVRSGYHWLVVWHTNGVATPTFMWAEDRHILRMFWMG